MKKIFYLITILLLMPEAYSQTEPGFEFKSGAEYYLKKGIINYRSNLSREINIEAINDFTKALDLKPEYAEAYYHRGNAKNNLNHYKDAIIDFTRAIELNPEYAEAYYNRGYAKYNLKDYYGANIDLAKAKEINPGYAETTYKIHKVQPSTLLKPPGKHKRSHRINKIQN